jgi:chemotaxis protein MotA
MDLATILGLTASVGLLIYSLYASSGGSLDAYWDLPSAAMVVGGAIFIAMLCSRMSTFLSFAKVSKKILFNRASKPTELIRQIVQLADVARREGILSLQNSIGEIRDSFLANGLQLVVDGTDADTVKAVLEMEMEQIEARHSEGKTIPDLLAKYAPAYGMIGTLVGLVVMLKNMDDVSKIGPGMAVALLTTLYGAVIANSLCLPLVDKLGVKHNEEMLYLEIAKNGILGLQSGDNPRMLEMKLVVFLAPKQRAQFAAEKA